MTRDYGIARNDERPDGRFGFQIYLRFHKENGAVYCREDGPATDSRTVDVFNSDIHNPRWLKEQPYYHRLYCLMRSRKQ
jgi:hypothetical protein